MDKQQASAILIGIDQGATGEQREYAIDTVLDLLDIEDAPVADAPYVPPRGMSTGWLTPRRIGAETAARDDAARDVAREWRFALNGEHRDTIRMAGGAGLAKLLDRLVNAYAPAGEAVPAELLED